jgi:hypothetical protein
MRRRLSYYSGDIELLKRECQLIGKQDYKFAKELDDSAGTIDRLLVKYQENVNNNPIFNSDEEKAAFDKSIRAQFDSISKLAQRTKEKLAPRFA